MNSERKKMRRPKSSLCVRGILAFAVAGALAPFAHGDATWTGASNQDWNTAANWSSTPANPTGNFFINTAAGNVPVLSANSAFTPVDLILGNGGANSGRFDHRAGTLSLANTSATGNWMFVGRGANTATGVYNLADTSITGAGLTGFGTGSGSLTVGKLWVGGGAFSAGGTGTVNINTTGTITANSTQDFGGANASTASVTLAYGAGSSGTVNLENGTVNANSEMWVGYSGAGTWNQSGGSVNSTSYFVIGRNNGAVGNFTLSGGSVNAASAAGFAVLGSFAGSNGTLNVSGGTFSVAGNRQLLIGEGGTGTLNLSGTGQVTVNNTANGGTQLGVNAGSNGTVNLNGGTLQSMLVSRGAGTGTFNFNGGTLKAGQSTASFMTGLTAANILGGGARFDSNGFNITVGQALIGNGSDGGLTKSGAGMLTLTGANTYVGPTAVNAGTLALSTSSSTIGSLSVANAAGLSIKAATAGSTVLNTTDLTFGTTGATSLAFDFNGLNPTVTQVSTGALTLNGTINVTLAGTGGLTTGTYTLIDYGSRAGNFSALTPASFTFGHTQATLVNNTAGTSVDLSVVADSLVWSGAGSSNWVTAPTGNTSGPNSWATKNGLAPTNFWANDAVEFNDTYNIGGGDVPVTATTVNISSANVSPSGVTFNNSIDYTIAGSFGITGASGLTKNGSGKVTIANVNTYTGATTITGGTLQLGDGTAGHDGTISGTSGVINNSSLVYNHAAADTAAYAISGAGSVTVTGSGTQTLSGANSYSGGTTVNGGGKLSVGANNHLGDNAGTLLLENGTLITTAGFTNTHPITIGAGGGTINVTTNGQLFMNTQETLLGTGPLSLTGAGTIAVGVGNLRVAKTNSYAGPITLKSGGIFEYGIAGAVVDTSTFNISNEGELAVQGNPATSLPTAITVSGGTNSILSFENGNAGIYTGPVTLNANTIIGLRNWYNYGNVISGTISGAVTGAGGITVNSGTGNGGLLTLSNGSNTYAGGTTLVASKVLAGASGALGTGLVAIGGANAQVQLGDGISLANAITINAGAGTTAQGIVWIPTATGNATVSGALTINAVQGAGGHFGTNGGTLTLTGPITSSVPVTSRIGTVVLSNTTSSYAALAVLQGTVKLGATNAIPVGATVDLGQSGAAVLDLAGFNQTLTGVTKNTSAATVTNSGTADSTLTTTGTSTYAGIIQDGATNKTTLAVSSGALTLTGVSTHTGGTTVNGGTLSLGVGGGAGAIRGTLTVNAGATAKLTAVDALGFNAGTAVTQININGGTLDNAVNGNNGYLASLALTGGTVTSTGGGTFHMNAAGGTNITSNASATLSAITANVAIRGANSNLPITVADGAAATDLLISGAIANSPFEAGANAVTKSGAGSLALSGANTYTGGTIVTAGLLQLDNGGTLAKSNISITGGTFGAGTTGAGGTINYIAASDTFDLISISGTGKLDLTNLKANFAFSGTQTQTEYVLADKAVGSGFVTGTQFLSVTNLPSSWLIDYNGTAAHPNAIVVVAVPEPSAAGGLLIATAAIGLRRRRRPAR